jgi:hypothetical protein
METVWTSNLGHLIAVERGGGRAGFSGSGECKLNYGARRSGIKVLVAMPGIGDANFVWDSSRLVADHDTELACGEGSR